VKRVSADDSADSRVKVGHRQAIYPANPQPSKEAGGFAFAGLTCDAGMAVYSFRKHLTKKVFGQSHC
ncbi:hypothetical protein, partial [Pelomonas sp. SE-A7]|uniref:hypothetical protein n=1 Tax=Pelomonas sp. SE-A7 TaxID=3054953 RepID=UPI00259CAC9B